MDELIKLISEKLGLAIDFVEANFEDVFTRYVDYEVGVDIVSLVVFSVLFILAVTYGCVLLKSFYKSKRSKESNLLIDYATDTWIELSGLGIGLLLFASFFLLLGLIAIPITAKNLLGWIKAPEIMILKELEVFK